jgi:hypothetical protein
MGVHSHRARTGDRGGGEAFLSFRGRAITALQFADELDAMVRRPWGLVAALGDLVEDHDDAPLSRGVIQLVEDATKEMERLAKSFDAERWLGEQS